MSRNNFGSGPRRWAAVVWLMVLVGAVPVLQAAVEAPAGDSAAMAAPAASTLLMVIYGDTRSTWATFPLPTGTVITCTNLRTGMIATGEVGAVSRGYYEAVFFSTDDYVAAIGDSIHLSMDDAFFTSPNGHHTLTAEDIILGSARIDAEPDQMSPAPLPGPVSAILNCYPNPFNPRTTIAFEVRHAGAVRLSVYDLRGNLVADLLDETLSAGVHQRNWNGLNKTGMNAPSGVYLAALRTVDGLSVQKLDLAR